MDAAHQGSSNSPPPFLVKTYEMVDDPSTNEIVSWSPSERSFVVWSPLEFARDLLPKFFKHNNFSSFIRQLNTYGFRKKDPDLWEFQNDEFIRGKKHLLKNIHRRKPTHSHSLQQGSSGPLSDLERQGYEDRIETLKRENENLRKLIQLRRETELKSQSLQTQLRHIQYSQRSVTSFLEEVVQKPNFLSDVIQPSEILGKKRKLPKSDFFGEDVDLSTVALEKPEINMQILEFDMSLCSLEKLIEDAARASGEELCEVAITGLPLTPVLGELHALSGESDVNMHSESTDLDLEPPRNPVDIESSSELAESAGYSQSPVIATSCPMETRPKVSNIDVNSEPVLPEASPSRDRSAVSPTAPVQPGANDVFWQQFLTESPGDPHEVQSERRDDGFRRNPTKATEFGRFWLTGKSVEHLTEQIQHLSPAEQNS